MTICIRLRHIRTAVVLYELLKSVLCLALNGCELTRQTVDENIGGEIEIAAVRSVRIRSAQAKCGEELSCLGVVGHCIEHHVLVAVCFQRRIGCHVRDLCIGEDNALNGVVCQCGFNRIIRQTSGNIGIGVQLTVLMGCRKIVLVKLKRRFTSGVDCCIGDGCRRCSNAGARHDSRHSCCSEFCDNARFFHFLHSFQSLFLYFKGCRIPSNPVLPGLA